MKNNKLTIKKILNNNVVSATRNFQEVIVVGLGIGFQKRAGQSVNPDKIEKIFELQRDDYYKMLSLAQEVNEDIFKTTYNIIKKCEDHFKITIDNHAYLVLIDHINFTLERIKSGYIIRNLLFEDLRIMYPEELKMALAILNDVNEAFDCELPDEEAGFLVMHIINGMNPELNNQSNLLTNTILDSLNIVRDHYLFALKPEDISTQRIMVHIKLLCQRIISNTQVDFKEKILYNVFEDFKEAYTCSVEIQKFLEKRFNKNINQQELVYLTIHLNRLEMVYHQ